jgi:D-amino peptidase
MVAVKEGVGDSTVNLHPDVARAQIRAGVLKALQGDLARCLKPLPSHFTVEIEYREAAKAYTSGFFPRARQIDPVTVRFEAADYFEGLRFLLLVL